MPEKDITVTQDETFTGGLCLIAMEPESNFIILEQATQARDQITWHEFMDPPLAQLNCRVIQSSSDEASGLLAYVEHYLEAHQAVSEATEQLERLQRHATHTPMTSPESAAWVGPQSTL